MVRGIFPARPRGDEFIDGRLLNVAHFGRFFAKPRWVTPRPYFSAISPPAAFGEAAAGVSVAQCRFGPETTVNIGGRKGACTRAVKRLPFAPVPSHEFLLLPHLHDTVDS